MLLGLLTVTNIVNSIHTSRVNKIKSEKKEIKQETKEETSASVALKTDMEYIKRGIDDIRFDVRKQGERLDGQAERLTRVEESAKQAHKRIDKLENEN